MGMMHINILILGDVMKKGKIDWDKYYFYPELERNKKISYKIANAIITIIESIYFIFRFYMIAVFSVFVGIGFVYYGLYVEQVTGIWMIMCMFAGMIIVILGMNLSIRRSHMI